MENFTMDVDQKVVRFTGVIFTFVGLYFAVCLFIPLQFDKNPFVWFKSEYFTQFIPFYIAVTLLLSGLFLTTRFFQANIYLAVFGHTASEEILFSWIGITNTDLPLSAIVVFFPLSLLALWLGYFNILKQRKLSLLEGVCGFVGSTALLLLPRFI
tara:strand:- start:280 stop:744 length:465 start_codon:yes stop_codon:yes gene_type:complete